MGWGWILARWPLVVADLSECYGIDVYDPATDARPWPWLRHHIEGLFETNSRLNRELKK